MLDGISHANITITAHVNVKMILLFVFFSTFVFNIETMFQSNKEMVFDFNLEKIFIYNLERILVTNMKVYHVILQVTVIF